MFKGRPFPMIHSASNIRPGFRFAALCLAASLLGGACTPTPRQTATVAPTATNTAPSTTLALATATATSAPVSPTPSPTPTVTPFPTAVPATATALPTAVTPAATVPPGGWDVTLTGATSGALIDTTWVMTALIGGPPLGTVRVTLSVSAGGVGGNDGCNSYGTDYQVNGATLHLGSPYTTMMFCPGLNGTIEAAYLQAFQQTREWWVSNAYLEFRDAGGAVLATFTKDLNPVRTATPETPIPLPTNMVTPTITSFTVSALTAQRGQTLTLDWATTDALTVTLQHRGPNSWWGTEIPGAYPTTGRAVITDTAEDQGRTGFILTAYGANGGWAQREVIVTFPCLYPYFFTTRELSACPLDQARGATIVQQRFERGWMIWMPYDTGGSILVLYDGGRIGSYVDAWTESLPVDDPTLAPPFGMFQPVRGFDLVWRDQSGVRDGLGWATAPEGPYATQIQSQMTGGDYKAFVYFFRLQDGRVVQITGRTMPGQWQFVEP